MLYRDITDTSESSYLFTLPDVLPVSMSKLSVDDPPPATSKGLGGGSEGVTQLPPLQLPQFFPEGTICPQGQGNNPCAYGNMGAQYR